jgi:hypothetical protein
LEKNEKTKDDFGGGKYKKKPGQQGGSRVSAHPSPEKVHGKKNDQSVNDEHLWKILDTEPLDEGRVGEVPKEHPAKQDEKQEGRGPHKTGPFIRMKAQPFEDDGDQMVEEAYHGFVFVIRKGGFSSGSTLTRNLKQIMT